MATSRTPLAYNLNEAAAMLGMKPRTLPSVQPEVGER